MAPNKNSKHSPELLFLASEAEKMKGEIKKQVLESIYSRNDQVLADAIAQIRSDLGIVADQTRNVQLQSDLKTQVLEGTTTHSDRYIDKKMKTLKSELQSSHQSGGSIDTSKVKQDIKNQLSRDLNARNNQLRTAELENLRAQLQIEIGNGRNQLQSQVACDVLGTTDKRLNAEIARLKKGMESKIQQSSSKNEVVLLSKILKKFEDEVLSKYNIGGLNQSSKPQEEATQGESKAIRSLKETITNAFQLQFDALRKKQEKHTHSMYADLEQMGTRLDGLAQSLDASQSSESSSERLDALESKILVLSETLARVDGLERASTQCNSEIATYNERLTVLKKEVDELPVPSNKTTDSAREDPELDSMLVKTTDQLSQRVDETQRALAIQIDVTTATWLKMTDLHTEIGRLRDDIRRGSSKQETIAMEDLIKFDDSAGEDSDIAGEENPEPSIKGTTKADNDRQPYEDWL